MGKLRDCEMEELIDKVLADDTRVDAREVDVRVLNGVVYLSGIVDSAAERHAVQEDAMSATEVAGVVDQLTLRNFIERTDPELTESVRHGILRDTDVDLDLIVVEAKNSVVTLSGRVADNAEKSSVETVAWWTPGVTSVVSRLQVGTEAEVWQETQGMDEC